MREGTAAKTVLVADDESSIRELYERELLAEGYRVITASSALEAIRLAREACPDLVVLDIRMPGMDGIEALNRILEQQSDMPVIINTAYAAYHESFLSWPADAYLIKSSDLGELKREIGRLIEEHEGHDPEGASAPGMAAAPAAATAPSGPGGGEVSS